MRLLRSFPALAYALSLLALATFCVAQRNMALLLVAGTLAAVSWYVTHGPRGRTLPRWVANLLVIAASLHVVVDLVQHPGDVMGVLGRFAVWLSLVKLYERKSPRDYAQVLALSLMLMIIGSLTASDLISAVMLLLYLVLGFYTLSLYRLYASFERSRHAAGAPATDEAQRLLLPLRPVLGRHPRLHLQLLAAAMTMLGLGISFLLFAGAPRGVGADFLGALATTGSASRVSGFNERIDLGGGGRVSTSHMRVLTLQVRDADGQPVRAESPVYLRGAVLDSYAGDGRWTSSNPSTVRGVPSPGPGLKSISLIQTDGQATSLQSLTITARMSADVLFSTGIPVTLTLDEDDAAGVVVACSPWTRVLRLARDSHHPVSYAVLCDPRPAAAIVDEPFTAPDAHAWQDHAFEDSEAGTVTDLAGQVLASASVRGNGWAFNRAAAQAFSDHLHAPPFQYSLKPGAPVTSAGDPVIDFLSSHHTGHCEYFATGMVALCHVAGVEARVVVGYLAYNYDESAEQYNILQSNAHAWVEVRTGENQWTLYDPTPPAAIRLYHAANATIAERLNWSYNDLESTWTRSVIDYDTQSQTRLAKSLDLRWSERLVAAWTWVKSWMADVNQFFNVGPGGYIWMGIVALAIVLAVMTLITLTRRSRSIHRTASLRHFHGWQYQRMLRGLGFYVDMLAILEKAKLPKPQSQPPLVYAKRLATVSPAAAHLVVRLTRVFYDARYGGKQLKARDLHQCREQLAHLAATLKVKA